MEDCWHGREDDDEWINGGWLAWSTFHESEVGRLHGPSYNYRPQWHPWFSTWTKGGGVHVRGGRLFQGPKSPLYTTNLCVCTMRRDKISHWNNPLVKGMLIRFVTKNSVQVYAHLIRLQFVAIIEFVGIQSASLSTIYGFLIHLFRVPVFLSPRVYLVKFFFLLLFGLKLVFRLFFYIEFYFRRYICYLRYFYFFIFLWALFFNYSKIIIAKLFSSLWKEVVFIFLISASFVQSGHEIHTIDLS